MSSEEKRIDVFDLVRTVAILTVLALHLYGSGGAAPAKGSFWETVCHHGNYGVVLFFTVSGFLITFATAKREPNLFKLSPRRFYIFRAARVLPLLALIVALGALFRAYPPIGTAAPFHACFWNPAQTYNWRFWTAIATFWFNCLETTHASHGPYGLHWDVLWTLSIEEQFYCLFPLIVLVAGCRKTIVRLLGTVLCLSPAVRYYIYAFHPIKLTAAVAGSLANFDQIAMGVMLFFCWQKFGDRLKNYPLIQSVMCFAGVSMVALTYYFTSPYDLGQKIYAPSIIAAGTALFCLGALGNSLFKRIPKILLIPGKLCYGLYLYQAIALYFSWKFLFHQNYALAYTYFVGLNLLISAISFKLYETPVNGFIRSFFEVKRKDAPAAATVETEQPQLIASSK